MLSDPRWYYHIFVISDEMMTNTFLYYHLFCLSMNWNSDSMYFPLKDFLKNRFKNSVDQFILLWACWQPYLTQVPHGLLNDLSTSTSRSSTLIRTAAHKTTVGPEKGIEIKTDYLFITILFKRI